MVKRQNHLSTMSSSSWSPLLSLMRTLSRLFNCSVPPMSHLKNKNDNKDSPSQSCSSERMGQGMAPCFVFDEEVNADFPLPKHSPTPVVQSKFWRHFPYNTPHRRPLPGLTLTIAVSGPLPSGLLCLGLIYTRFNAENIK